MSKIITIDCCQDCPYYGECKAWKRLTREQRVKLTISTSVPHDFILKACPLPDLEPNNNEETVR